MQKIKTNILNQLYKDIIPFWKNYKDEQYGGWIGFVNHHGIKDIYAKKGSMLQIRVAWFFARLYKYDPKQEYKDLAKHQFDFILEHIVDKDYGIVWEVDYKGVCLDNTKHLYYQSFGLFAATQYYDSFKDERAALLAHQIFDYIEKNFKDEEGYIEQIASVENRLCDNGIKADRTMNSLLHLVEAYTTYTEVFKKEESKKVLKSLLDLFEHKIYNSEKERLEVLFDHHMNSIVDFHSYGHDIEASWLLDLAVETLDDKDYKTRIHTITDKLCKHVYEKGMSQQGIKTEKIEDIEDDNYIWWVQSEGAVAFFKKWISSKNESYKKVAIDLINFINDHQKNKKIGEVY